MRPALVVAVVALTGCVIDVPCPAGKSRCGGYCIDESSDPKNCGACYLACGANEACNAGHCVVPTPAPSCTDGVKNGSESAVDCGGGVCSPCAAEASCNDDGDCLSTHCGVNHFCATSGCDDGIRDGTESDVDCGGSCSKGCQPGARCNIGADCLGGTCLPTAVCGIEGLTLMSDVANLVAGSSQVATLTASLVGGGLPVAGASVRFETMGPGQLLNADAGVVEATTDASGNATATLEPLSTAGLVTVTAMAAGQRAVTRVSVTTVQAVEWVSTKCNGNSCTVLGSVGSGFNETALVTFRVRDSAGLPVAGEPVSFSAANVPVGLTLSPMATTDMSGLASTNVHSGSAIGSFSVHAAVSAGISVDSPAIAVIGAKPTNNGMVLQCNQANLSAYDAVTPPAVRSTNCTVVLLDRYSNPIATGTAVNLKTEAGTVPGATALSTTGVTTGQATFTFSTTGLFPAFDVAPLPADSTQQTPGARDAEPSYNAGGLTMNPRDGLVTLIAYVQGEEYFGDWNTNGIRDATEPFIDQGEPLVDSNDNGVQDVGEFFFDTNSNCVWDGPNGTWDAQTTVWTDTTVLYTGLTSAPESSSAPATYGTCPGGVAKGAYTDLEIYAPDARLNQVVATSTLSAVHTASSGSVAFVTPGLLDGYGFFNMRMLLDAAGQPCNFTSDPVCQWKRVFQTWGGGYVGKVRVTGAPMADTGACMGDTLTVTITTESVPVEFSTTGAIQ